MGRGIREACWGDRSDRRGARGPSQPSNPVLGQGAAWPTKPIRVIVPLTRRQRHRRHLPRVVFDQVSAQLGPADDRRRNRVGGGGTIGRRRGRQGGSRRLHTLLNFLERPYDCAGRPSKPGRMMWVKDFSRHHAPASATCPMCWWWRRRRTSRRFQQLVAAAQGQARSDQLCIGRHRARQPHLTAERFRLSAGFEGAAHSVQRSAGSADRGHDRSCRFLLLADRAGRLPLIRDGPTPRVWRCRAPHRASTLPKRADDGGGRLCQFGIRFLDRPTFVPSKTPREIVNRLHQETVQGPCRTPSIKAKPVEHGSRRDDHDPRGIRQARQPPKL